MDRTELILDIFALRAKSAMARAQVELAQMQYALPRLKRLWTHLGREVGSGKGGIGSRGPGEKQLETDRRLVRHRIGELKQRVADMQEHRVRQTHARGRWFSVCLVGYTNRKSTRCALTGADVFIQDRLFATLDTTSRVGITGPEGSTPSASSATCRTTSWLLPRHPRGSALRRPPSTSSTPATRRPSGTWRWSRSSPRSRPAPSRGSPS